MGGNNPEPEPDGNDGPEHAAEALRESEERYRAVMEQSVEAIYLYDAETKRVLESNASFRNLMGYSAEELLGMQIYDFISHDRENIDDHVRRSLKEGRRHLGERSYLRKDGTTMIVETSASVVPYNGKTALCAVSRDVTERKRFERVLKESEERYRRLVENAPVAIAILREGRVAFANAAGARLVGADSPQDVIGEPFHKFVHPDYRDVAESRVKNAIEGRTAEVLEEKLLRLDGSTVYVEAMVMPTTYEGETAAQSVIRDITERKRAEEALKESEERHRAVVEQSVEAIYFYDPDTRRVLEANPAFECLIGYTAKELRGMAIYDFIVHDRADVDHDINRNIAERQRFVGERTYRRKDGTLIEADVSAILIPYRGGDAVCVVARDVTERKRLEEQLRHQVFHDPLTELPNRALFVDRLGHALTRLDRSRRSVAVLFVDLDNFKIINDSLGHATGNDLLRAFGEQLRASVRPRDTVARIFGDEFAVLLEDVDGVDRATRIADRIAEELRAPFWVGEREIFVTASVGIALSEAAQDRPEDVLRNADLAMYVAKSNGKARHEVFAPRMNISVHERMDLESDLRRAIEHEEFVVHFQPIVELRTGRVAAVEALARWEHPERGLIASSEFIHVAEQTGLIVPIGQLALEAACKQALDWQERLGSDSPRLSVNLSPRQFFYRPELITEVLRHMGVEPKDLWFEITERAVMDDAEVATDKLKRMKDSGAKFAIDDYGTGYSCLYYLKHLPVDFLKMDGVFVEGLGKIDKDEAIVTGTVALGHALGLMVIAEGVETAEQLARLKEMGCDLAQGFYFSEPLPANAVEGLLAGAAGW